MRKVEQVGDFLHISFDYDERLRQLVRALPERQWDPIERCWKVPKDHVVSVVELLEPEGFSFDRATKDLYEERKRERAQDLTVSELNARVQAILTQAFPAPVWVVGEILGYDKNAHKDRVEFHLVERREGKIIAQVEAILFPEERILIEEKLARAGRPFSLTDEIVVRVLAQVDLWVREGVYRLVIRDLDVNYTLGEVARRREEILRKLSKEGILDRNRSLPFPALPLRVGLITSLGSDAQNDVLKTLRDSGFAFQITIHGARVQGHHTEPSILNALDWFRAHAEEFDVILICRGGGSRADLAWFDSEALARAVALFPIPVIVGIGHEEDYSVLDWVGWRPKPATPSGAAKFLVQKVQETLEKLETNLANILHAAQVRLDTEEKALGERERRLVQGTKGKIVLEKQGLGHREKRLVRGAQAHLRLAREKVRRALRAIPQGASRLLGGKRTWLSEAEKRLLRGSFRELGQAKEEIGVKARRVGELARRKLVQEMERLSSREGRLRALDPKRVVERGFAILRLPSGKAVTDPIQAPEGTFLTAELRAGVLRLLSQGGERAGEK